MQDDEFEWDDIKAASNERNHHVTFEMARAAFRDAFAISRVDHGHNDPGERYAWLGMVENRLVRLLHPERREDSHHISEASRTPRTTPVPQ